MFTRLATAEYRQKIAVVAAVLGLHVWVLWEVLARVPVPVSMPPKRMQLVAAVTRAQAPPAAAQAPAPERAATRPPAAKQAGLPSAPMPAGSPPPAAQVAAPMQAALDLPQGTPAALAQPWANAAAAPRAGATGQVVEVTGAADASRAAGATRDKEASGASGQAVELPSKDAGYLHNPLPEIPRLSIQRNERGRVVVAALIDLDGRAQQPYVKVSSGYARLDDTALAAVKAWRYVPGKRGGVPVAMWFDIPFTFGYTD